MLFMKRQFFAAIRSGRKTTTLRFWARPRVRPGSVHSVRGLGKIRVTDVQVLDEQDLTHEHAHADGFGDLQQLRHALAMLYPPSGRAGKQLYLVRFQFLARQGVA